MAVSSAFALIQTVNPAVSTGSIIATVSNTMADSLLLVFVGSSALTDTVSSVVDNANNVYTKAYSIATGTGGNTELWYKANAQPTTSITVNFSASTTTKSVFVREYQGMGMTSTVLDKTATASGSGTSVVTATTANTIDPNELVVCSTSCLGTIPALAASGIFGNFTSQSVISNASVHAISDAVVTTMGPQTGAMTASGTLPVWDIGVATFIIIKGEGDIMNRHVVVGDGMGRSDSVT